MGSVALPAAWREGWRERAFDVLLATSRPLRPSQHEAPTPFVVVDIDEASVVAVGEWPWRRATLARLLAAVHGAQPRAVGVDILFGGPDTRSPAALARRLGAETNRRDLQAWAETLDDDDKTLAQAISADPVALGFALDPLSGVRPPGAPISLKGEISDAKLWRAKGAVWPPQALADAATGLGALPLFGDSDGVVRRAPALVAVAGALQPGLALETLRLSLGEPAYEISADPRGLAITLGARRIVVPDDGLIRLAPDAVARVPVTKVSAATLLAGTAARLPEHAVVWVGASAPEANGRRASAVGPLTPSFELQAAALWQLRDGFLPARSATWESGAAVGTMALVALGLWVGVTRPPARSAAAAAGVVAALWALAAVLAGRSLLWDPTLASLLALAAFLAPAFATAARAYWWERRMRSRFEQVLPPSIVARIAADPRAVKLAGERRVVTALFTDIEGFTGLMTRIGSEELVRLLDGYFEGVTQLILAHGGMVDKFVGDAVLAFFGMPLDLDGHAEAAVRCALALAEWTERHRAGPEAAPFGWGRTRIGVEAGDVVAGEVGRGAKLSYTAYGEAVNLAARLEAANKLLQSDICVGPAAARACPADLLRPTARLSLPGIAGAVETWAPWPAGPDEAWRLAYARAWAKSTVDLDGARRDFEALGCALSTDPFHIRAPVGVAAERKEFLSRRVSPN